MPFARVLVFALALTHAVGLVELVLGDECTEDCADDGCGKDCLPGAACRCHAPSAVPLAQSLTALAAPAVPSERSAPFVSLQRVHASPDPREILHVPRRGA